MDFIIHTEPITLRRTPPDIRAFHMRMAVTQPPLHEHDSHEWYYCMNDGGWQHTSAGSWPMRKGQLWFFAAGTKHIGQGASNGTTCSIVMNTHHRIWSGGNSDDSLQIMQQLISHHGPENPLIPLVPATGKKIKHIFTQCADESKNMQPGFRSILRSKLFELIALCACDPLCGPSLRAGIKSPNDQERLTPLLAHLDIHYREAITIEEMCQYTALGRSQFHQIFERHCGCSPGTYIHNLRIAEAQRLLVQDSHTILDIALDVGYGSLAHFYKQFKRRVGASPHAWFRRQQAAP